MAKPAVVMFAIAVSENVALPEALSRKMPSWSAVVPLPLIETLWTVRPRPAALVNGPVA